VIEVRNLRKTFGELVAVDGIGFAARPGAIFGLLGPNGAGKTTALRLLLGFTSPDQGSVRVRGLPPEDPASRIVVR